MAIPAGVSRVSIRGTAATSEIWETGFWVASAAPDQATADADAANIKTLFLGDWINAWLSHMTSDMVITEIRVYAYPAGGPRASFVGVAPIASGNGTDTSGYLPLQVAPVLTLLTGASGRRNRGRMYLPLTGFSMMGSNHLLSTTATDAITSAAATFFSALGPAYPPVVLSIVGSSHRAITEVAMDNRPDVQRRRANKEGATHRSTGTVTP